MKDTEMKSKEKGSFLYTISMVFIGISVFAQQMPVKSITIPVAPDTVRIGDITLSPDGSKMAVVEWGPSFCPSLWDVQSGHKILQFSPPDKINNAPAAFSTDYGDYGVAFAPNGRHVLIYGQPYYFALYEADTGHLVYAYLTHQPPYGKPYGIAHVMTASFSPDGKKLLVDDFTGSIQLRDASSGELLKEVAENYSNKIQFLPDSVRCFVESGDHSYILDTETKEKVIVFSDGDSKISPKGRKLFYRKPYVHTAELWNLENMESAKVGQVDPLMSWNVVLSDDDLLISLGEVNKELNRFHPRKVYDAKSLKKLYEYPINANANKNEPTAQDEFVLFFPDGKHFLTVNGFTIHIYDLTHLDSKIQDYKSY